MHYDSFLSALPPLLDMTPRLIILKHSSDHLLPLFDTALHQLSPIEPHWCYSHPSQHGLYADTMFPKYRITFTCGSLSGNMFLSSLPEKLTRDVVLQANSKTSSIKLPSSSRHQCLACQASYSSLKVIGPLAISCV